MAKTTTKEKKKAEVKNTETEKVPLEFSYRELKVTDKSVEVRFCNVRLAFASIAKPDTRFAKAKDENGPLDGKYSATLLIPKNAGLMESLAKSCAQLVKNNPRLKTAEVKKQVFGTATKLGAKGGLVKDGDKQVNKDGVVYEGLKNRLTLRVQANAVRGNNGTFAPVISFPIVYKDKTPIQNHELSSEIYSGCWCNVAVNLSVYDFAGNVGITAYIAGIQKIKDDKKLGGSDPFENVSDMSEDVAADFDLDGDDY